MRKFAICPVCSKTIEIEVERQVKTTCPDCGSQFMVSDLVLKRLYIDARTEAAELNAAKEYFSSCEYRSASEHFKRALAANKNSYAALYFSKLCDIYLSDGADGDNDVMSAVVDMIRQSLVAISHSNAPIADKLLFITAMLSDTKIIITKRLLDRDDLYQSDIDKYRKLSISDLTKLLDLFKIEREQIMSFSPEVAKALAELVDCAIKVCYKAVQTVMVGEEIKSPCDEDYKKLSSLCNELCFFGHSFDPQFDSKPYSPDFSQNYEYNSGVINRIKEFEDKHMINAQRNIVVNIEQYEKLLDDCKKALELTYLNCYRSMCSRQVAQHAQLFFDGFELVYRLMLPRVVQIDKKKIEVRTAKYADMAERCDILTRFLVDAFELDESIGVGLHCYYEKLYDIVSAYYLPEMAKLAKNKDRNNLYYQQLLYDCACSCAPALDKYVDFSDGTDKVRAKLVKICSDATGDFLLHAGISIDEIEQSNFYRPILQISNALVDEEN